MGEAGRAHCFMIKPKCLFMDTQQSSVNKDLILRERLALQRTAMANDTTLLSFLRTSLYFSIAGMSVNRLLHLKYGLIVEFVFWMLALLILSVGLVKYQRQKRSLKESEQHIGDYKLEWEADESL